MRGAARWMLAALLVVTGFAASAQEVVRYVHTDALGSPVAESDEAGNIVARYDYEPYGAAIGQGPQDGPAFTGHVSDLATGLTYMQQRYYDPELGAFLSVDPVSALSNPVGAFSRYWYADGNPFRFRDPDGRASDDPRRTPKDPSSIMQRCMGCGAQMVTSARSLASSNASSSSGSSELPRGPSENHVRSGTKIGPERNGWIQAATVGSSKQAVDSSGPILLQPGSSSGPLPTNQFYFSLTQRPLAKGGELQNIAAPPAWFRPTVYGSGLTGMFDTMKFGFSPSPSPGPGGTRWYIEVLNGASTHDNAQHPYINVYVPAGD